MSSDRRRGRAVPVAVIDVLHGSGLPLPVQARASMEARLGHDFAHVRVHADEQAGASAEALAADAYAFGPHIVFGRGRYRPGADEGHALLVHELVHVAQQASHDAEPRGVALADAPAERHATACAAGLGRRASGVAASPSLIHRQPADAPAPPAVSKAVPAAQSASQAPAAKGADAVTTNSLAPSMRDADLATRVRTRLNLKKFGLPIVADGAAVKNGDRRVFFGGRPQTLNQVTDETWSFLKRETEAHGDVTPTSAERPVIQWETVWSQVWQYYNEKLLDAEKNKWQSFVQLLYTPQYNLTSTQPGFKAGAQQSMQLSGGRNLRFHGSGHSGPELQIALNLSLFNSESRIRDAFQNFAGSAQLQQVLNLGHEFHLGGAWATLQASYFMQIAAGLGTNYFSDPKSGEHRVRFTFLVQPSAGGQVNLNVWKVQVIVGGAVVYSESSERSGTGQPGHFGGLGVQGSIGAALPW
jgi:hypothetical protein